ncbi:unnamed protein product [Euphydryas editha]|uniref:Uncharacterized protein n=1 Tax=Euphydryas editha TaxID=104508 RepID=A0AAU9V0D8_EUPED|nr:unnamed protein product [Euphydryas editha]
MHPQRVTVWCGFWAEGIIRPYFFENEEGQAVTVTGHLKSMIYVNKPTSTVTLKEKIQCCFNEIQRHLCKIDMKNFDKRVFTYQQSLEGHLPDVFHK